MSDEKIYDVAVIGGGLAGLCVSILLARKKHTVILFEKIRYPFHKVCGEYISMESWHFLTQEIGLPLNEMNIPLINKLHLTSPSGISLNTDLGLGGFGISRYKLDDHLKQIAEKEGVTIKEECKAEDVVFDNTFFKIITAEKEYKSKVCCGSWGKRSNIDVKWKRPFIRKNSGRLNNYTGIKYHVTGNPDPHTIGLHNFKNGYCGISKIEDDKYSLCYFMKASVLKLAGNSIEKAEKEILSQNPHLKKLLNSTVKVNDTPLAISQVSLSNKKAVENNVLMLGDAAGMISPLCGNGMSMAMHSAKISAPYISAFLSGQISRKQMEMKYTQERRKNFGKRIVTGRLMQFLFGRKTATDLFIKMMKRSPYISKKIIAFTHGKPF